MRKRHWLKIAVITVGICLVAGLILAVILFNTNPGRTGVSSSIEFSFEGAENGLAPNGYRYDLNGFQTDEVLDAALKDTGLEETYTADQIRSNLIIAGVYPKDIVEQMTGYESLLTGDAGKVSAGDYHATLYSVTLYNDFDKSISRENLEKILEAVMKEYRAYFEKTYAVSLSKDSLLSDLSDYDYPQQLEILSGTVTRNAEYAREKASNHPDFQAENQGFSDISVRYNSLQTSELERLSGLVTLNALSVNPDWMAAQYENQIRVLELRLKEQQTEAENVDGLIDQYTKDGIIYISTSSTLQKVGNLSADTYDSLVARKQEIADSMGELNKELAQAQMKLNDLRAGTATETAGAEQETEETETAAGAAPAAADEAREAQMAAVGKGIAAAQEKCNRITEDFSNLLKAYSEREMNDSTIATTSVKYFAPKLLSGTFAVLAAKTAGPICVLGLLVCIVIMISSQYKAKKKADKE